MYGDNELQGQIICRIGIHVAEKLCGGAVTSDYKQASLFFNSDGKAKRLVDDLGEDGYIAVSSDMTYKSDMGDIIERLFVGFLYAVMWVLSIFFIAMFVNMCTNRTVAAFRDDIAIMRSMGIPAKVIRIGIYVRMLISLVPSLILLPVSAYIIYHNEEWNGRYWYLQPWQYVVLIGGMLYLTIRITRKQIKNLFGTSVKKTLRGGEE
jgi:ABC-type lipoprotein release transport system permease subunit